MDIWKLNEIIKKKEEELFWHRLNVRSTMDVIENMKLEEEIETLKRIRDVFYF